MIIKICIDRIVLESGSFSPSQRRRLQADIETELVHLLIVSGIPNSLRFGRTISNLPISLRNISSTTHPAKLGQNIAFSIYSELTRLYPF